MQVTNLCALNPQTSQTTADFLNFNPQIKIATGVRQFLMLVCLLAGGLGISVQAQNTINVTHYGAVGDAVQFYASTVSNSVVVTTTNPVPDSAIGEPIEVFGCGTVITPPWCQDMIATITNIVDGTNIYVSKVAKATLTSTFTTYGHDNTANFQSAIAAVGKDTNDTIIIPAGKYLFLCPYNASVYGNAGIILTRGGLHFVGENPTNTILLSQGAWTLSSGRVNRSFLIDIKTHVSNDYPVSFENLTLDGGVDQGKIAQHRFPASTTSGRGWDITHDAIIIRGGKTGNVFTHQTWTNCVFQHWRGEMVKSNDNSTNGNLTIINCVFNDGNATAINYYASLLVTNCVFNNLFQIAEYYQAYNTNTSYFVNNLCTNITGNGFAFNGGKGNNPPFYLQNNRFYVAGNPIETTPGDNIFIISNYFNGGLGVNLGCPGYQGTFDNSNIVVADNVFDDATAVLQINGGAFSANRVESVQMYGNVFTNRPNGTGAISGGGWCTNIDYYNNDFSSTTNGGSVKFKSGTYGSQYILIPTNNIYYTILYDLTGKTNTISYATGSRYEIVYGIKTNTVYALVDTNASQMPAGAQILIYNNSTGGSVPVYLSSSLTGSPVIVPHGQTANFYWRAATGSWSTSNKPLPTP